MQPRTQKPTPALHWSEDTDGAEISLPNTGHYVIYKRPWSTFKRVNMSTFEKCGIRRRLIVTKIRGHDGTGGFCCQHPAALQ